MSSSLVNLQQETISEIQAHRGLMGAVPSDNQAESNISHDRPNGHGTQLYPAPSPFIFFFIVQKENILPNLPGYVCSIIFCYEFL